MTGLSCGNSFGESIGGSLGESAGARRPVPPWKFGVGPAAMNADRGSI
jgi:hypothetical protein